MQRLFAQKRKEKEKRKICLEKILFAVVTFFENVSYRPLFKNFVYMQNGVFKETIDSRLCV